MFRSKSFGCASAALFLVATTLALAPSLGPDSHVSRGLEPRGRAPASSLAPVAPTPEESLDSRPMQFVPPAGARKSTWKSEAKVWVRDGSCISVEMNEFLQELAQIKETTGRQRFAEPQAAFCYELGKLGNPSRLKSKAIAARDSYFACRELSDFLQAVGKLSWSYVAFDSYCHSQEINPDPAAWGIEDAVNSIRPQISEVTRLALELARHPRDPSYCARHEREDVGYQMDAPPEENGEPSTSSSEAAFLPDEALKTLKEEI